MTEEMMMMVRGCVRCDYKENLLSASSLVRTKCKDNWHLQLAKYLQEELHSETAETCPSPGIFYRRGCLFPELYGIACKGCGQRMDEGNVILEHARLDCTTNKDLKRLRQFKLDNLLKKKKLCLVLDLDNTLLHSIEPSKELLKKENNALQEVNYLHENPTGSLFKVVLDSRFMLTKLRPYVRAFLEEASSMYDMYICTMGTRKYARRMADLLDPERKYFNCWKIIAREDFTSKYEKSLDKIPVPAKAVIILDDREDVWKRHKENLIAMEQYKYFDENLPCGGLFHSESLKDESENRGALSEALDKLKLIHEMVFYPENDMATLSIDVRPVLNTIKTTEIFYDCKDFSNLNI